MTLRLPAVLAATLILSACSSGGSEPSDETFCDAIQDWNTSISDVGVEMADLGAVLSAIEDPTDLPPPDDLHESAARILASADDADRYLTLAVANSSDPEVAKTIAEVNRLFVDISRWMGEAARDSEDVLEFSMVILKEYDRMSEFEDSMAAIPSDGVEDYVLETCGSLAPLGGAGDSASVEDTAAKADVATLGKEIATYYVDHSDDDPDPVITISGPDFYLLDNNIGPHSDNVIVTDQYYEGSVDWCIEVTNSEGLDKVFTYSAQYGLQQGTCQQLRLP